LSPDLAVEETISFFAAAASLLTSLQLSPDLAVEETPRAERG